MEIQLTELEKNYIMVNHVKEGSQLIIDRLNRTLAKSGLKLDSTGNICRK